MADKSINQLTVSQSVVVKAVGSQSPPPVLLAQQRMEDGDVHDAGKKIGSRKNKYSEDGVSQGHSKRRQPVEESPMEMTMAPPPPLSSMSAFPMFAQSNVVAVSPRVVAPPSSAASEAVTKRQTLLWKEAALHPDFSKEMLNVVPAKTVK